jgi:hypothetical protein
VNKNGFGDILSGLRDNSVVRELDVNNCELEDEELHKLVEVMKNDECISSLKIGHNNF